MSYVIFFVSCISWAVPKNILIQRKYQKTYWIFCICTFTPCVASNKDVFKHEFLDLQPHLRNLQQYWPLLGIYNTHNFVYFYAITEHLTLSQSKTNWVDGTNSPFPCLELLLFIIHVPPLCSLTLVSILWHQTRHIFSPHTSWREMFLQKCALIYHASGPYELICTLSIFLLIFVTFWFLSDKRHKRNHKIAVK